MYPSIERDLYSLCLDLLLRLQSSVAGFGRAWLFSSPVLSLESFFLETKWRRGILALCVFPIAVFKNGLRIVTISLLAAYVDPIFIDRHWIHSSGGIPFFIVALLLLVPVVWVMRRWEKRGESSKLKVRKKKKNIHHPLASLVRDAEIAKGKYDN